MSEPDITDVNSVRRIGVVLPERVPHLDGGSKVDMAGLNPVCDVPYRKPILPTET